MSLMPLMSLMLVLAVPILPTAQGPGTSTITSGVGRGSGGAWRGYLPLLACGRPSFCCGGWLPGIIRDRACMYEYSVCRIFLAALADCFGPFLPVLLPVAELYGQWSCHGRRAMVGMCRCTKYSQPGLEGIVRGDLWKDGGCCYELKKYKTLARMFDTF